MSTKWTGKDYTWARTAARQSWIYYRTKLIYTDHASPSFRYARLVAVKLRSRLLAEARR